ncbi:MAG TPA: MmcQ/YjbR family DNA-binding protein [Candidatus Acidoferrum sp.]|nr:MmcQ/YjbR family DNA-binding protein [Candidatus Acidoferrum sp.]
MAMEWVRKLCKSLPHTTEEVLWGNDLVFKVGGKMYAVTPLDVAPVCLSFKSTPENFAELCERDGVIPAPYSARYFWVALEREDAIPVAELKALIRQSYDLVKAKLPKKKQAELQ